MSEQKYVPKRGVFEATLACNLNCRHCGSEAGKARDDELTTEECGDMFRQLSKLGMSWITISGGEPMSREDWPELIALSDGAGIRTGMITNAIALDLDAARLAKSKGLKGIGFSVDGLGKTHDKVRGRVGHFNRLMAAMDHCNEVGLPFSVVTTLNNDNLPELEELHKLFSKNGCYAWQVQLGSDMGNMRRHPRMLVQPSRLPDIERRLSSLLRKGSLKIYPGDSLGYFGPHEKTLRGCSGGNCFGGCAAGMRNIGIESNGNVKGCLSIMPGYNQEGGDWVEGNIRENTLEEIWNRPGAFAYTREWNVDSLKGFCATCGFNKQCRGGCVGKRVSDENLAENRFCTYRVLIEERKLEKHSTKAAAVILAGILGAGAGGCDSVDDPKNPRDTETTDTASDTRSDTASDTQGDSGEDSDSVISTDPVVMYGVPEYGIIEDTDTQNVDEYGIPDTGVVLYGIPADMDTGIDTGIPIYSMVPPGEDQ